MYTRVDNRFNIVDIDVKKGDVFRVVKRKPVSNPLILTHLIIDCIDWPKSP